MRRLVIALLFLAACSNGGSLHAVATSASPSSSAISPSPSSVAVTPRVLPNRSDVLAVIAGPKNSSLSLVGSDGVVIATTPVDLKPFQANALMSWTSPSQTREYYLNGGSEVRFLTADGRTAQATKIALGASEQAGFAVSPDDRRIAVAVFSYTLPANQSGSPPTYDGMRLYVEDVQGGGHHVDIHSSTTVAEFPIGWTGGQLVMAVVNPLCCRALPINPYAATSYHVVDPATGRRLASLCENSAGPEGPIEPAGAICLEGSSSPRFQRWDGSLFAAPAAVPNPTYLVALSPDGTRVAVGGDRIRLMGPAGRADQLLSESGYALGWLDAGHIVFERLDNSGLSAFDLNASISADLGAYSAYLGTFPTPLV